MPNNGRNHKKNIKTLKTYCEIVWQTRRHSKLSFAVSGTSRSCSSRDYYPENGCETNIETTVCACDTDLCNGEVMSTQSPAIECYRCSDCANGPEGRPDRCAGEICIKDTNGAFTIYGVKLSSIILARKYQYSQTQWQQCNGVLII